MSTSPAENDPITRVLRRPDALAGLLGELELAQQPVLVAELLQRIADDSKLAFEVLADSSGRWATAWRQAGDLLARADVEVPGLAGRLDEKSASALFFTKAARPVFDALIGQMPGPDAMRRSVCAVIFGILKRGEWRKWHTVLRGLDAGMVNAWLLDFSRCSAAALQQATVTRFSPLFARPENYAAVEDFAANYLDGELATYCAPDDALSAFRNELLRRRELTFEDRMVGLAVLLAQVSADPLTELEPLLTELGLGLGDMERITGWFLSGTGERPTVQIRDVGRVLTLLHQNEGIREHLSAMRLWFDADSEVVRANLQKLLARQGAGSTGILPESLAFLESAMGTPQQAAVLQLFGPAWGDLGASDSVVQVLSRRLLAENDALEWLESCLTRSNLIRSLANADLELRQGLTGSPGPDALMASALAESLAAAGSSGRARLLLLFLHWHAGARLDASLSGWLADSADAFIHGQVFAFSTEWGGDPSDLAVAADLVRYVTEDRPVPESHRGIVAEAARSSWRHLAESWKPDMAAGEEHYAAPLCEIVERIVISRLASETRFDREMVEEAFGTDLSALLSVFEHGSSLPGADLGARLLGWMHRTPAWAAEFAGTRARLAVLRYQTLGGKGDPSTVGSKLAVACRHVGGLRSRNDILQASGARADELDAWSAQFLDGTIDPSSQATIATRAAAVEARPNRSRIRVRMTAATIWPRIAAVLVILGLLAFGLHYLRTAPPMVAAESPTFADSARPPVSLDEVLSRELGLKLVDPGSSPVVLGVDTAERRDWPLYRPLSDTEAAELSKSRRVTLAPFWIGTNVISNLELEKWVPAPSGLVRRPTFQGGQTGDRHPAVNVTFGLALEYCRALTQSLRARFPAEFAPGGRLAGWILRPPTEEEWEYAAAAGQRAPFWWGPRWADMPAPIKSLLQDASATVELRNAPGWLNGAGLTGFHYNVAEWVSPASAPAMAPELFPARRVRGSGWPGENRPEWQRGLHFSREERLARDWLGFRIVLAPGRPQS